MMAKRFQVRAMALATILVFVPLMIMMVTALIVVGRQQVFVSQGEYNRIQALYLAESGVSQALLELSADPMWSDELEGSLSGVPCLRND